MFVPLSRRHLRHPDAGDARRRHRDLQPGAQYRFRSIGIALVQTLLVRNTQIAHASLGAHVNYANPALQDAGVSTIYNLANGAGMTALNGEITRQASMIAYVDDYWLMMILTLAVIPAAAAGAQTETRPRRRRSTTPPSINHERAFPRATYFLDFLARLAPCWRSPLAGCAHVPPDARHAARRPTSPAPSTPHRSSWRATAGPKRAGGPASTTPSSTR